MAEDVLGITGIVNIDDIKKTFDALISDLDRLGAETDVISARMSKALTDIANSSEKDLAAKTKAAMQVLNDAIAQTNKQLTTTPEMLKNAEQAATRLQQAISKLEKQQGQTIVGSKEFDELKQQLDSQREAYSQQVQKIDEMRAAQQGAADSVSQLNSIYINFLSSLQQQNETEREAVDATAAETQATREQTEAKREDNEATKQATQYNAEFVKGLEDIAARATEMGTKLGGTAKVLSGSIAQNASFVRSHLEYIEKQKKTLEKALKSGDKEQAAWAEREIKQAEQRVQQAADSIQSFMQTIEAISSNAVPLPEESATSKGPRQQLMELRNEITMLTLQWREMTEAERASAEGQELKQKLDELSAKAAKLQDAFGDVQEQIKNDANDTAAFAAVTQGLNLLISGFGAAEGAAAALGMSEEELARAQTIIQGSLAATNFLTEAGNALQGQSALMRGISTIQTLAAAKATDIETAAKGRNVVVTKAAAVAQGIFNAIAKANPYVLLAMAIVTVVGALAAFALGSSKASKAEEEHQKELERTKEIAQEAYGVFNSEIAKTLTSYQRLQTQWRKLSSEQDKQKWIKKNAQEFKTLGVRIDNTSEAERFLVNNTSKVIEALSLRAQAAAYAAKAQKEYEKALSGVTDNYTAGKTISMSDARELFGNNWTMYGTMKKDSTLGFDALAEDDFVLNQRGVDLLIERAMGPAQQRAEMWLQTAEDLKKQAEDIYDSIGVRAVNELDDDTTTTSTKDKPKYKSAAELNDELLKLTQERVERELEAEKEGTKRWEQLMRERIALQAEADRRAVQKASDEAVADLDASYKGGKSGLNEQQYTERRAQLQQQAADAIVAINAKQNADIAAIEQERQRAELASMLDYLKQYGSIQQQKYAIAKEYDEKIAKKTDKTQREILEAQKKQALDAFDMEVLKAEIDWTTMFDGIGNALEEEMKATLDKVEKFIQSKSFRELDAKEKAEYVKMRNELVKKTGGGVGTFDFSIYHQIGEDMKAYQQAIRDAKIAKDNHTAAVNDFKEADAELKEAEKNLAKAMNNIASNPQAAEDAIRIYLDAKGKQQMAYMVAKITGKKQDEAEGNVIVAQGNLTNSTTQAQQAIDNFSSAIGQMTSGSLRGFADGLVNLIAAIGGNKGGGLSGLGKAGGIIGAILSIIDAIGSNEEGLSGVVAEIIDKIVNVITSLIDNITNGDFFRDINTAVGEGIQKILEHLFNSISDIISNHVEAWGDAFNGNFGSGFQEGFGVGGFFGKIFGERDGEKTYAEIQEEISDRIEEANKALDRLTEQLKKSYGVDAINKAEEAQKQLQKNQSDMIKGLDAALWDNYGGGESDYRKWNRFGRDEGIIANLMQKYRLKSSDMSWNALFNENSADEIARMLDDIRNTDFDLWSRFKSAGYNEGAVREWMEKLADTVKESDDIQKALEEKLTTTTKENVFDDFLDSLYSLADGSETVMDEIAKNWQKMVNRMVINNLIGESFQQDLNSWYKRLAKLNERRNKGEIDNDSYADQLKLLKQEYDNYVKKAQQQVENLRDAGIIASTSDEQQYEQDASSKSWQTMSQDTADELNGRFTALYECGLQLLDLSVQRNELLTFVTADVSALKQYTQQIQGNVSELLDVQLESLTHLQNIDMHTEPLPDMATVIEKIYNAVKNVNKK